jgi:hypothetical protein
LLALRRRPDLADLLQDRDWWSSSAACADLISVFSASIAAPAGVPASTPRTARAGTASGARQSIDSGAAARSDAAGQLEKIREERRDRFERVHHDARERFTRSSASCTPRFAAVLLPDQQQKFEVFLERRPPHR